MTLEPLVHAPAAVQAHVATVLPAGLLGLWLLVFSRKGSRSHRAVGVLFLALMVLAHPLQLGLRLAQLPVLPLQANNERLLLS